MTAIQKGRSVVTDLGLHVLTFIKGTESASIASRLNKEWRDFSKENSLWVIYLGQDFKYFDQTDNPIRLYKDKFCDSNWNLPRTRILNFSCKVEGGLNKRANSFGKLKISYVLVG